MLEDCHNLVITLFLVNKLVIIFSRGCYKVVATLFLVNNLVTILSQGCNFYVYGLFLRIDKIHKNLKIFPQKFLPIW